MILAPIVSSREAELRGLLDSMNETQGRVNPNNPLVPFAQFDTLHFARFVILDDKTVPRWRGALSTAPTMCPATPVKEVIMTHLSTTTAAVGTQ